MEEPGGLQSKELDGTECLSTHTCCKIPTSKCFINQEGIDVGLFSERQYGLIVSSDTPAEWL